VERASALNSKSIESGGKWCMLVVPVVQEHQHWVCVLLVTSRVQHSRLAKGACTSFATGGQMAHALGSDGHQLARLTWVVEWDIAVSE
jgi:hypothetical protein